MAWNLKEKIGKGWAWLTAHPLTFTRVIAGVITGLILVVAFLVTQFILGSISGWLIILEVLLVAMYAFMVVVNAGRQEELDRKARRW